MCSFSWIKPFDARTQLLHGLVSRVILFLAQRSNKDECREDQTVWHTYSMFINTKIPLEKKPLCTRNSERLVPELQGTTTRCNTEKNDDVDMPHDISNKKELQLQFIAQGNCATVNQPR